MASIRAGVSFATPSAASAGRAMATASAAIKLIVTSRFIAPPQSRRRLYPATRIVGISMCRTRAFDDTRTVDRCGRPDGVTPPSPRRRRRRRAPPAESCHLAQLQAAEIRPTERLCGPDSDNNDRALFRAGPEFKIRPVKAFQQRFSYPTKHYRIGADHAVERSASLAVALQPGTTQCGVKPDHPIRPEPKERIIRRKRNEEHARITSADTEVSEPRGCDEIAVVRRYQVTPPVLYAKALRDKVWIGPPATRRTGCRVRNAIHSEAPVMEPRLLGSICLLAKHVCVVVLRGQLVSENHTPP